MENEEFYYPAVRIALEFGGAIGYIGLSPWVNRNCFYDESIRAYRKIRWAYTKRDKTMDEELEIIKGFVAKYPDNPIAKSWAKMLKNQKDHENGEYYKDSVEVMESGTMTEEQLVEFTDYYSEGL